MSKISAKSDASSHQNQAQDGLQRDPGEIEQRPHTVAVQFHKGIPSSVVLDPVVQVPVQVLGHPGGNVVHQRRHLPVDALDAHHAAELEEGDDPAPVDPITEELLHHGHEAAVGREGRQVQLARHLGEVPLVAARELVPGLAQGEVDAGRRGAQPLSRGHLTSSSRAGGLGAVVGGGSSSSHRSGSSSRSRGRGHGRPVLAGGPVVAPLREFIVDVLQHYLAVVVASSPGVSHGFRGEAASGRGRGRRGAGRTPKSKAANGNKIKNGNSYNPVKVWGTVSFMVRRGALRGTRVFSALPPQAEMHGINTD